MKHTSLRRARVVSVAASVAVVAAMTGYVATSATAYGPPASETDATTVPHYFGPWPNWANSPLTTGTATVAITDAAGLGTGATAIATVGAAGTVTGLTLTAPGSGYVSPEVSITGTGTGAAATALAEPTSGVTAVTVAAGQGGTGYTALTAVADAPAAGTTATLTASGGVDQVTVTDGGTGYTMPTVDFDLPDLDTGTQPKAHAEMDVNGTVTAVVVDDPGTGYLNAPQVVIRDGTLFDPITGGGSGAAATATLTLRQVDVVDPGSGYTAAPAITIGTGGTGAVATASIATGTITSLTLDTGGTGYLTHGIKKFQDPLPQLCMPPACPTTNADPKNKAIPVAVADTTSIPGSDQYVIALVQFRTSYSSDLPATLTRGYVQLETDANAPADPALTKTSQSIPLFTEKLDGTRVPILAPESASPFIHRLAAPDMNVDGSVAGQLLGVTTPSYLGPTILAEKDRATRIVFFNLLPNGTDGNLFLPVDSTLMGSGTSPNSPAMPANADQGTVTDEVRNPLCTATPNDPSCFEQNRATLHLHGGTSPWISDGTPHQWITPAGGTSAWPQGVSVSDVPDMMDPANTSKVMCSDKDDGCQTFYYTNQQSARLLFYHDHAWGITRLNVYAGEAAGYLIGDSTEQSLISAGVLPTDQIPLIVQDKTFVPDDSQLYDGAGTYGQDPTWDKAAWGGKGSLWFHHVYMPAQNPGDPSGMSAYGRWMYGPWFWPPATNTAYGPIANPYYDPSCILDDPSTWTYQTDPFCEPELIPGTPNLSTGMEQFNDTPTVNGVAYPTLNVDPKSYRLRMLNAANDRFFNFQWYVADPRTGTDSEVALDDALLTAAQTDPNVFPTPVDASTPTTVSTAGPDWIQVGSEGGFLPSPVVIDGQQPTTWITDPTRFDVGNVDLHSLLIAPAERADVIVDFSQWAGRTLILYNDAPAAFPARVASYDYYTGAPDLSPVGAPSILPGYGPNTRTVMQVKVAGTTPAAAFNLKALQAKFQHNAAGTGVFESSQHPIIVGQAAYNKALGTSFAASGNCVSKTEGSAAKCDGYVRVNDTSSFNFNTLNGQGTVMRMPLQPKAIHDEMNSTSFDEYGRMQATLGIEAQPPAPGLQNVTLYPYVNPGTEFIDGTNLPAAAGGSGGAYTDVKISAIKTNTDGTQIWRITHNGVDTHPVHFHLFDVQVLNRVTWDNIIIPNDANENGWKDTVRVSPLEDTIVALRPVIPQVPFEVPNAVRPLNPADPIGSTALFNNVDPQGNPTAQITNRMVNFGWEYVFHCHILTHEEMDMMRPVSLAMPPLAATAVPVTRSGSNNVIDYDDNSITDTGFQLQRSSDGVTWANRGAVNTAGSPLVGNTHRPASVVTAFTDQANASLVYAYRVAALNTVGYGAEFPSMTVRSYSNAVVSGAGTKPAAPTGFSGTLVAGPQVNLAWTDNATNENGFAVDRSTNGGSTWTRLATLPARNNTGGVSYADATVKAGTTYVYRVSAFNGAGFTAAVPDVTVLVPAVPAAPSGLTATNGPNSGNSRSVVLTWTDNSTDETGFTLQRATNSTFTQGLSTTNLGANVVTTTATGLNRNTQYWFRIRSANGVIVSAWVNATPFPIRTNP